MDCFTGQSPGKDICTPAAPDVQGNLRSRGWDTTSVRRLDRGFGEKLADRCIYRAGAGAV